MKGTLLEQLSNTLVGNTDTITRSTNSLNQLSMNNGFCVALMEIVDQVDIQLQIKQAALVQLKNCIKKKWKPIKNEKIQIDTAEKNLIKNSLILAVIRCAKNYQLIKLYKQIITIVVHIEYQNWMGTNQIIQKFSANQDLSATLHCLIAICSNFQFSVVEKQKKAYTNFLRLMLPEVLKILKNNFSNPELIYLGLKFLWKALHYEMPLEIKILTNPWMELVLFAITSYNEELHKQLSDNIQKNTPHFYYFHSKKWATRILLRFIQKLAKQTFFGHSVSQTHSQFCQKWHEVYGVEFINYIVQQMPIPTIKKVRYFQLKIIQGWTHEKPSLMQQYARNFLYNILLPLMALRPQDQQLAKSDAMQYLRAEDQHAFNFTNIKRAAMQLWITILHMGSKINRQNNVYTPGPLFQEAFQFVGSKLESKNLVQKQLAMYLLCQMRLVVAKIPSANDMIPEILGQFIIPELRNPATLLRARANQMFKQYVRETNLSYDILKQAAQGIFVCLSQDPSPLVNIKAASAFHEIISHKETKKLIKPFLNNVLEIYLKLIKQYDLQQIVIALQYIVEQFAQDIGPYSVNLFKYLTNLFIEMFRKDQQKEYDQSGGQSTQLAASGLLKTMSQIIQSPLDQKIRLQIQPYVLQICAFLFSNYSLDHTEELMHLLNIHIFKIDKLTPEAWFFLQVNVYFLVGIPQQLWPQIQQMPLANSHKEILVNLRSGNNIDYLQFAVPVLRNFISKGRQMVLSQSQQFQHNFLQMFFYLIGSIYKKHSSRNQGQILLTCSSMLQVYLVQTYPTQFLKSSILSIWSFIKFNTFRSKSVSLKCVNTQLIAVMFWKMPQQFLKVAMNQQNCLQMVSNQILNHSSKLDEQHERKRIIIGILNILSLPQHPSFLLSKIPQFFKLLLKLVMLNCKSRKMTVYQQYNMQDEQKKALVQFSALHNNYQNSLLMNQGLDDDDQYDQDDQDFWEQQYQQRYVSPISNIDQLVYFREMMDKLQINSVGFYTQLMKTIPNQYISKVSKQMDQCLNLHAILKQQQQNIMAD